MSVSPRSLVFALLSPLLIVLPLSAQSGTIDAPAFTLTAQQLQALSAATPATPLTDVTILYDETSYRIAPAGTVIYSHRYIYRIETQNGVQGWAETSVQWDPWLENQAQLRSRVLPAASSAFLELDPKTITDAPVNSGEDETYSNARVRKAPLPGVAVGAIVEEFVSTEEKQPFFTGGSVYRAYFSRNVPVVREKLLIELPASAPFHHKELYLPAVTVTDQQQDGLRHIVFDQGPLPPRVNSDIDLASPDNRTPLVEFSTGASWHAVASQYAALSDPQIVTGEVKSLLPSPLPTDRMQMIQALVQRLHREVRYTGIEFGSSQLTPQHPSEVLARHFGDCKDKATLLVAMLRATGIPANLALLNAGTGLDVNPDLPGMNQFNHAIVYVSAAGSQPELWIDATANFSPVGTLPYDDYNRYALIIQPGTQQLARTPVASSRDNALIETRTLTLPENGPSHVVESSQTHGFVDSNYRSLYGGADTRKSQEDLENYAHNVYLAKDLAHVDHTDGSDLSKPFNLTLIMDGVRRGSSGLSDAAVAIFPTSPLTSLPAWFRKAPDVLGPDATPAQRKDFDLAQQQRSEKYSVAPISTEQRYRISVPDSFTLRALPPNKTTQLGPAQLTESYASEPGLVTATLHFTLDKPLLSLQEVLDLRQAVLDLQKRDLIMLTFDQQGVKLIADGKVREGLAVDRKFIDQHPKDPIQHLRLANALLNLGVGPEAKAEALRATQIDPKSAVAWSSYAWILEHNEMGIRFGAGYDRAASIAAYRKSIQLDADNNDYRFDLAILEEFDAQGIRYTPAASLTDAIADYRALIDKNKDQENQTTAQYKINLLYDLVFAHQYDDAQKLCQQLPASATRNAVSIAVVAAQQDVAAGRALADRLISVSADRSAALRTAGNLLAQLRLYPKAADLISAAIEGNSNAADAARQVEIFRSLKTVDLDPLAPTDPRRPVQAMFDGVIPDTLNRQQAVALFSRHAYGSDEEWNRFLDKALRNNGVVTIANKSDFTAIELQDIILGNMTLTASGDDATGHPIIVKTIFSSGDPYFVVKEDGSYKLLSSDDGNGLTSEIGDYVLYLLDHSQFEAARALLDWKRDQLHKAGGDDSLSGPLLTRFWTVGDKADPEAMRLAAAALLSESNSLDIKPLLPHVAELRDKAPATQEPSARRTSLNLILAGGYLNLGEDAPALAAAQELLTVQPDSVRALRLAGAAFTLKGDSAAWLAMLEPLLAKHPQDPGLLRQKASAYELKNDYADARKTLRIVLDGGKSTSNDYNSYAWLGLFDNKYDDDTAQAAQQSNILSKNSSFAALHTLACIDAMQGKTTEARKVLEQAMSAGNLSKPNPSVWFALGLIYEQYGVTDAAIDAYSKVEPADNPNIERLDLLSNYKLARQHLQKLKSLAANPAPTQKSGT